MPESIHEAALEVMGTPEEGGARRYKRAEVVEFYRGGQGGGGRRSILLKAENPN